MKKKNGKTEYSSLYSPFNVEALRSENVLGNAIAEARKNIGMNASDLGRALADYGICVQRGAVSKWELGVSVPSAYQLLAICSILRIEDAAGFFSGQSSLSAAGMQKVSDYKNDLIASGLYAARSSGSSSPVEVKKPKEPEIVPLESAREARKPYEKMVTVNFSVLRTSAGTGCYLDEECFEPVEFPESAVPRGTDFAVQVSGNSMEPDYHDGQTVFVRSCTSLRPGEIGLFILDGEGYIKMYDEKEPSGDYDGDDYLSMTGVMNKKPVLVSLNEDYDPIEVEPYMNLQIVGKILN